MSYSLVIIKPDAVRRNLVGEIIRRYEMSGLKIVGIKRILLEKEEAEVFYLEHMDKKFFPEIIKFMTSGPVVVLALEGKDAWFKVREINGDTDPKTAKAGTIRQNFGISIDENSVHGSDSFESAERETAFFFRDDELLR